MLKPIQNDDNPHGTIICPYCGSIQCGTLDLICDNCHRSIFSLNIKGLDHVDEKNIGIEFNRLLDTIEQVIQSTNFDYSEDQIFTSLTALKNAYKYFRGPGA